MPVPTEEQAKQWRDRWGSEDNPDDVDRIRKIVKIIQKTREREKIDPTELIKFLEDPQNGLNIQPLLGESEFGRNILIPDLRGFRLDFLPYRDRDLLGVNMRSWHLEAAVLGITDLRSANLREAHLESVFLMNSSLESANLMFAHLELAFLSESHLESADLFGAHLESAQLNFAFLEGADFSYSYFYKEDLMPADQIDEKFKDNKQLIGKNLAVNFTGVSFKPRLRHQFYRFNASKSYMFEPHKIKIPKFQINYLFRSDKAIEIKEKKLPLIFGKLKTAKFIGVSTNGVDWSGNRIMERYIKDQQFLYEFKRNHPIIFHLWNFTSKCGQSIYRLTLLILIVIFGFALVYDNFQVVNLLQQDKLPGFWAALYTSVNIFSNLGMGIKEPATKAGALLIMIETMLGFVALGLLLTVAGSRFARRS